MAALDGAAPDALARGFTQKTLRQWMQKAVSHRSFAVVAHPVERAHRVFSRRILGAGPESYPAIREALRTSYKLPLPDSPDDPAYDAAAHRAAFLAFLGFLKGNLGGQTSIRVDPAWASQSAILQGMGEVLAVDHILREPDLAAGLARLADEIGAVRADVPAPEPEAPHPLAAIYDAEIEAAARAAYRRDYMMFGFGDWA